MPVDAPRFEILTPRSPGSVAVIRLDGASDPSWTDRIGLGGIAVGRLALRRIYGIDDALLARPDDRTLLVMPHGGVAVVDAIAEALSDRGCERLAAADGRTMHERLHRSLARAASPLAIDLLLDQPRRWDTLGGRPPGDGQLSDASVLRRLIDPPAVVAVGRPNIGKSSLLNRLAGRSLALASDRAGTTRDAVGAMIDAAGLVVRWIDTPGLPEQGTPGDALADEGALIGSAVASADLVVLCRDAGESGLEPGVIPGMTEHAPPVLRVVTRTDRRGAAGEPGDLKTSAATGSGIGDLVVAIRESLVPRRVYEDPRPWMFWA